MSCCMLCVLLGVFRSVFRKREENTKFIIQRADIPYASLKLLRLLKGNFTIISLSEVIDFDLRMHHEHHCKYDIWFYYCMESTRFVCYLLKRCIDSITLFCAFFFSIGISHKLLPFYYFIICICEYWVCVCLCVWCLVKFHNQT